MQMIDSNHFKIDSLWVVTSAAVDSEDYMRMDFLYIIATIKLIMHSPDW